MPLFLFHVPGRPEPIMADLPSIAEAKCEAARCAAKLLCEVAHTFWDDAELTLVATDETRLTLFTLTISGTDAPAIRISPTISA